MAQRTIRDHDSGFDVAIGRPEDWRLVCLLFNRFAVFSGPHSGEYRVLVAEALSCGLLTAADLNIKPIPLPKEDDDTQSTDSDDSADS